MEMDQQNEDKHHQNSALEISKLLIENNHFSAVKVTLNLELLVVYHFII